MSHSIGMLSLAKLDVELWLEPEPPWLTEAASTTPFFSETLVSDSLSTSSVVAVRTSVDETPWEGSEGLSLSSCEPIQVEVFEVFSTYIKLFFIRSHSPGLLFFWKNDVIGLTSLGCLFLLIILDCQLSLQHSTCNRETPFHNFTTKLFWYQWDFPFLKCALLLGEREEWFCSTYEAFVNLTVSTRRYLCC